MLLCNDFNAITATVYRAIYDNRPTVTKRLILNQTTLKYNKLLKRYWFEKKLFKKVGVLHNYLLAVHYCEETACIMLSQLKHTIITEERRGY